MAAVSMSAPSLPSGAAWAAPPTMSTTSIEVPGDRSPGLSVEVDPSTLDADALRVRVLDEGSKALARRAEPLEPEDEIHVRVDGQTFDYRIGVELRRRGVALAEQPAPSSCRCSSSELLQAVMTAIDDGARRLQEAARAEAPAPVSSAAGDVSSEPPPPMEPKVRERPERPDRFWVAGVVLSSIGAATSVAGTTMALVDSQPVKAVEHVERDWRSPGYALLGVGAAMLVGGVAMIVVDELRCRRRGRCRTKGERRSWAVVR